MDELLVKTLESFGFPVFLQGSLSPEGARPDELFTYWNDTSEGEGFYSDEENAIVWQYSINFYSTNPERVGAVLMSAKDWLKAAGFTVTGGGYSVASDSPAQTGRGITVYYRQNL